MRKFPSFFMNNKGSQKFMALENIKLGGTKNNCSRQIFPSHNSEENYVTIFPVIFLINVAASFHFFSVILTFFIVFFL